MRFYTRQRRPLVINLVSLMDILTILLLFFIVTTTFRKNEPEVRINLPESTQGTEETKPTEPVILYATKDQKIFVGTREVQLATLTTELKQTQKELGAPVFALKADEEVPLGFFVKVMDAAKEAGLSDLSLFTEKPGSKP
ncbi:MAG: biopolymer transporter ExbD [Candidatus Methylacidiphilales bacterium]|nr:biopolymer transporter ExbD [Candidatus Methylacidiphilales bacterium]